MASRGRGGSNPPPGAIQLASDSFDSLINLATLFRWSFIFRSFLMLSDKVSLVRQIGIIEKKINRLRIG